jgi:hypothetical protein
MTAGTGAGGGTTAAGAAAAPSVSVGVVREALAVVLTDLGTRAKNAGGGRASQCTMRAPPGPCGWE